MNIVFLIGNGFDLNIGLETSYPKFYEWYYKQDTTKESVQLFKKALSEEKGRRIELWRDLELFLGDSSKLFESAQDYIDVILDVNDNLRRYISIQNNRLIKTDEDAVKILTKNLINPGEKIATRSRLTFESFVRRWNGFNWNINIISFNYTDVLERILLKDSTTIIGNNESGDPVHLKSIKHIHGTIDNTILVGVDNIDQITKMDFRNNYAVQCKVVKPMANYSTESMVDDECLKIIDKANLLCVFGCSLGPTDETWWRAVKNRIQSDKSKTLLLLLDYNPNEYNLDGREFDRSIITNKVIDKFLSKEYADIKGNVLVGLNTPIFDIGSHCEIQQIEKKNDNKESVNDDSFWQDLFRYDSISNEEFEIMLRKVELAFKNGSISLSFVELVYAIIRLAELDSSVSPINDDFKRNIKLRLKERLDESENLEILKEKEIEFSTNVKSSNIPDDNVFMEEILKYYNKIISELHKTKKGKLVIALENVNNENVDKLRDILKDPTFDGSSYQYYPVFDKINIDSFISSVFSLSNESKKRLRWFFENRYLLVYRFNDDLFKDCKSEISNLTLIVSEIDKRISSLEKVYRASVNALKKVIELSIKRCEGNRDVLITKK